MKEKLKTAAALTVLAPLLLVFVGLALAAPALTLYGAYVAATGGGFTTLVVGAGLWGVMALTGGKKNNGALAAPAVAFSADEQPASLPLKTLAPDFNLDAAVTLGKKITVGPSIKLKSKPHDLGQP